MEINYEGSLGQNTWKDGIEFYDDINQWARRYEARAMVPTAASNETADELVPLLLHYIPWPLLSFSRQAIGVLMGERLRWAMMCVPALQHESARDVCLILTSLYQVSRALNSSQCSYLHGFDS